MYISNMKLHSYVHHHHNYYRGHQLIKIKKRKKERKELWSLTAKQWCTSKYAWPWLSCHHQTRKTVPIVLAAAKHIHTCAINCHVRTPNPLGLCACALSCGFPLPPIQCLSRSDIDPHGCYHIQLLLYLLSKEL